MAEKPTRVPPELEDVAEQVGEFIEYWGFKKIHGRIWTHLFLAAEPLDATDLIERLGVSKALISMSISDLTEYDVIQSAGKGPRGTLTYRANPDVVNVISNILRKRERRMLCRISSAIRLLKESAPAELKTNVRLSKPQVHLMSEMVQTAETTLDGMLQFSNVSFSCWSQFCESDSQDETGVKN